MFMFLLGFIVSIKFELNDSIYVCKNWMLEEIKLALFLPKKIVKVKVWIKM